MLVLLGLDGYILMDI